MSNPNPMHSRCGLEDCDCEYTIGYLLIALKAFLNGDASVSHMAVTYSNARWAVAKAEEELK